MKYKVYIHTSPSGKKYVGLTKQNAEKRWQNGLGYLGCTYFYRAIEKYGWENITHEIVADKLTKAEAINLEIETIEKYNTNNPKYGYNLSIGGETTIFNNEARQNMSEAMILRNIENPLSHVKLSYEIASEIRKLYATGKYKVNELSEIYEVSSPIISNVIANKIWVDDDYIPPIIGLERARNIRRDYKTGNHTQKELGEKYNVSRSTIYEIVHNLRWTE